MPRIPTTCAAAAIVLLAMLCPAVRAETEPSTVPPESAPPQAPAPEVPVTTDVQGSVPPDIVGRWLAVCQVKLQSGMARPIARLFEVRRGAEHMELALGGDVPTPVNQKMTAAANAGQAWVPAVEDLREVNEKWRPAKIEPRNYAKVEYRLLGSDAFPPEFSEDETTKGSQFAIAIKESFPGGQAVRMTYSVFGVRNRTPTVLSGTAIISTVAVAPFPLPIVLKGDFQAYRLGEAPARSVFQRISDLFSGCRHR